jgi:hypothetical protein
MSLPQPPSSDPALTLNIASTSTGIVPIASFGGADQQLQARRSIDMQVSESGMLAITVNRAKAGMRARLSSLQSELSGLQADFNKTKESISASFRDWCAHESAALSTLYATFTTPAANFLPGTADVTYPKLPNLDWETGKASATFDYSYTQRVDRKGSITITVKPFICKDIPSDVLALKANLDQLTVEITRVSDAITRTRKALGNSAELESIARGSIAEQMLIKSGDDELAKALNTAASDANIDGLINSLSN